MTTEEKVTALEKLCDPLRDHFADPFVVQGWTVGSNGGAALAFPGSLVERVWKKDRIISEMRGIWEDGPLENADRVITSTGDLRAWAGEPHPICPECHGHPELRDCPECGGKGVVDCECRDCGHVHEAECWTCEGEGQGPCERCDGTGIRPLHDLEGRRGTVGGRLCNKALWAVLLESLPDEPVTIYLPPGEESAFVIRPDSDDWRAALMPLRRTGAGDVFVDAFVPCPGTTDG